MTGSSTFHNRSTPLPGRLLLYRALLVLALLASQIACTATTLPPYEATYTTRLKGVKVTGVRKLEETEKNRYRVSWNARALWMRLEESSEFELVDGNTVRPIRYEYTRRGLGSDRPIRIDFDYATNTVHGSKGDKRYRFDLLPNTQDKLSYQVQMQLDLMRDANLDSLVYAVAGHNRIKDYEFNHAEKVTLKTDIGEQDTLVYVREKRDSATYLWLSPEQRYLPVKIEQHEDGKKSSVKIRELHIDSDDSRDNNAAADGVMSAGIAEESVSGSESGNQSDSMDSDPLEDDDF